MAADAASVARPATVETVLLDAGGVLLDLDYAYLLRLIEARRHQATVAELSRAEALARMEIDRAVKEGGRTSDSWRDYFHYILQQVGVPGAEQDAMIDSLWEAHQRFGLWTVPIPGGPETVAELKRRGLRVGVVSNAEGRVETDLEGAGYQGLFETVVDSHHVGVEKPDPAIFALALERMSADPQTTIFAGDVPSVDVVGAQSAGIAAVLIDRHDHFAGWDVPRLGSIAELPAWLDQGSAPDQNE